MVVGGFMEQVLELLKEKTYQIPKIFLLQYHKLNLTDQEFIMLFYLWNRADNQYNPKQISEDLSIPLQQVLEIINNLSEKGCLSWDVVMQDGIRNEVISLQLLYEKLAFLLMDKKDALEPNDLYATCERELGRQLSPSEIETIRGWIETGTSEETLILAIQEAVYNGITHFRYIDKILMEWEKKGIKTKADVEKNRRNFKKSKVNKELIDCDWLNDDGQDS